MKMIPVDTDWLAMLGRLRNVLAFAEQKKFIAAAVDVADIKRLLAEMSQLTFSFPMPPNLTNTVGRGSNHWRAKYATRKTYIARLDELQNAGLLPPPPTLPFKKSLVSSVMHLGAAMDDDNALARHKVILDFLKTRGYIVDDRKKNLVWHSLPEQVVKRMKDGGYRIELTLREMPL
jgi:hypothetical protein